MFTKLSYIPQYQPYARTIIKDVLPYLDNIRYEFDFRIYKDRLLIRMRYIVKDKVQSVSFFTHSGILADASILANSLFQYYESSDTSLDSSSN